ncbi:hypothetical protein HDE_12819 [Halotydeus destructor]|nr:hypothetical protein HDE_12819 [Halotydeus destructor]
MNTRYFYSSDMDSSPHSLCDLQDDVIRNVLQLALHIWDVFNFTATSLRFHSLSEKHLKTLKYLDLRKPYNLNFKTARAIEKNLKKVCLTRFGNQLREIKLLNTLPFLTDTKFIDHLQLLPKTMMTLIANKEHSTALYPLRRQVYSNQRTIMKQRRMSLSVADLTCLSAEMDKFDSIVITGLRQDLSAVERLDVTFWSSEHDLTGVFKCCSLFSSLRVIRVDFVEHAFKDILLHTYISLLADLMSQIDDKVCLQLSHRFVLDYPLLIIHMYPRLMIDSETEGRSLTASTLEQYENFETFLSCQFKETDLKELLRQVSCSKRIVGSLVDNDPVAAERVICFHGQYTEKIELQLCKLSDSFESSLKLINCLKENCRNLKTLILHCFHHSEAVIISMIEHLGHSLENITIKYDGGKLSLCILTTIFNHCPKLRTLESNGLKKEDVPEFENLYELFRLRCHLDYVKLKINYSPSTPYPACLHYCNGKMALVEE